jgi:hypothetical protein
MTRSSKDLAAYAKVDTNSGYGYAIDFHFGDEA